MSAGFMGDLRASMRPFGAARSFRSKDREVFVKRLKSSEDF
jgi:hypothetical protein